MNNNGYYRQTFLAALLTLPTIIILAIFLYYPTIKTFLLSFYQVSFLGLSKIFVGFENYYYLLKSNEYLQIFKNTIFFVVISVFLNLALGLGLAVLVNKNIKGRRLYRLFLIWPYALPPAVAGVIFLFLFNAQTGIVNYALKKLMNVSLSWLSNPYLAMSVIILAFVWKTIGYNIIFFLAALQNISGEILEAATIDGATSWQCFWKITFPLISPITLFLFIMNSISAFFDSFAFVDILTRGGPSGSTTFLIYSIYRDGFEYFKTGLASAESVILFICVVILSMLQLKLSNKKVHYVR